jgi:hypothetical protein
MHVHPAIERLRSEGAPQPHVDAVLAGWRALPEVGELTHALAAWGADGAQAAYGALARLLASRDAAMALVAALIDPLADALRHEPLAQPAIGFSATPGLARIRLIERGRAALSLAVFAPRVRTRPGSVLFEDGEAHELVLEGCGEAVCYRLGAAGLAQTPLACVPGTRITRGGGDEARQILGVTRPLLLLQLTREAANPAPSREVALPSGQLIGTISASKRASQLMMALGVIGALGHRAGLVAMEALALDMGQERDGRWEALRQVLGLDARTGMALLARLAVRPDDPLAAPATRLRADLLAAQPELATLETA